MISRQGKKLSSRIFMILSPGLKRTARPGTWLLMLLLFSGVASAQFGGPALPLSTPVNPPTTITTDPAISVPRIS